MKGWFCFKFEILYYWFDVHTYLVFDQLQHCIKKK